jgi:hypothetical protein
MWKLAVGCFAVVVLAGCAGRAPQLSPLVHAADQSLSCSQIAAETKINNERISRLAAEQNWKMGQNAVAGIVGFMVWPAWLALDFQDAAGKEAQSISQRNEYLLTIAKDRCQAKSQIARSTPAPASEDPTLSALASNTELVAGFVNR